MRKCAAVVVGRNLNALGVVRSLAAGGVASVLLCTSRLDVAALSRHARVEVARSLGGRDLLQALRAIRLRFAAKPVLFLTEDDSVASVAATSDELSDLYHLSVPPLDVTNVLSDKALFHEFGQREGLPLPRGRILRRADDIGSLGDFELPIVVKPANKARIANSANRSVILAKSYREAIDRCRWLIASGAGALAQAWIGGPDDAVYFCLFHAAADGTPLVLFTGRKFASSPPRIGSTAICAPAPEAHAELAALTTNLAKRLRFSGMGSLEFKWDARARRFLIIEPTVGRSDWQEEIATLAGVNIPLAAYAHYCGLPAPHRASEPTLVAWRSSFRHRSSQRPLPPGAPVWDGYWRLSDPVPGLYYLLRPTQWLSRRIPSKTDPPVGWSVQTPRKISS
jgi:predicted ATP-grasp superfamily ATP-dependent carboligase